MKLFFLFLGIAAWQDFRTRSISLETLMMGSAAGLMVCVIKERQIGEIFLAMLPGLLILLVNLLAEGIIGEGDGLFFLVTGFFLNWKEAIMLFVSGQIFCSIFGLALAVSAMSAGAGNRNIRKTRLPFLPFLLPAALWLTVMRFL